MGVSKVEYGENTLIDLTEDTVNQSVLGKGYTAHGADGEPIEGAAVYAPLTTSLAVTEEGISALDGTVGKALDDKISTNSDAISQINNNLKWKSIDTSTWSLANGFKIDVAEYCQATREVHLIADRVYLTTSLPNSSVFITVSDEFKPANNTSYIGLFSATFSSDQYPTSFFTGTLGVKNNVQIYGNNPIDQGAYRHRLDIRYRY